MLEKILFFTNSQKVLAFLIQNPDKEYFDRQISKLTGISRAGANFSLRDLAKLGLVLREKKGRMYFYKVSNNNVLIKYLKILQNIIFLSSLIDKINKFSLRIILYGSAANGTNTTESDIDIFVITNYPDEIEEIMFKDKLKQKIQYVVRTPNDLIKLKKNNPAFYNEVEKGITLWEGAETSLESADKFYQKVKTLVSR